MLRSIRKNGNCQGKIGIQNRKTQVFFYFVHILRKYKFTWKRENRRFLTAVERTDKVSRVIEEGHSLLILLLKFFRCDLSLETIQKTYRFYIKQIFFI